jgi:outer membrane protein
MKQILLLCFLISSSYLLSAQKFGYLNSVEILSKVPAIAIADSALRKYQDTLMLGMNDKIKLFQKHVTEYQAESQKGNLAPIAAQKKEEELQKEQESLRAMEEDLKNKLALRRDQLYNPVLDKIDAIVKRIGKENSYTMIFDSSQPGYLYLQEADNLGDKILKEVLAN